MVGMVVTISPSLSLYNMVVLPAASRPTMSMRISFLAKSRLKSLVNDKPILPSYAWINPHRKWALPNYLNFKLILHIQLSQNVGKKKIKIKTSNFHKICKFCRTQNKEKSSRKKRNLKKGNHVTLFRKILSNRRNQREAIRRGKISNCLKIKLQYPNQSVIQFDLFSNSIQR